MSSMCLLQIALSAQALISIDRQFIKESFICITEAEAVPLKVVHQK